MSRDIELKRELKAKYGLEDGGIQPFSALADEYRTTDGAKLWLDIAFTKFMSAKPWPEDPFSVLGQIPEGLQDTSVMRVFLWHFPDFVARITGGREDYLELIGAAVQKSYTAICHVREEHETLETLDYLLTLDPDGVHRVVAHSTWGYSVLTPEFISKACGLSHRLAMLLEARELDGVDMGPLLMSATTEFDKIRSCGKGHLLTRALNTGLWPERYIKPAGLDSCIDSYAASGDESEKAVLIAYAATFPTAEVVQRMKHLGKEGAEILTELYSPAELKPFLRDLSLKNRGQILESEMGM
ncbi:hypothetical protein [Pseudomonas putida]|uniref:Uncharacterized protein n=1 Tax=Pseudomonas putida TaxID=303 RepID=A0A8I1ECL1_PSEPU|nr:hypothetical protein [Pseudomonas putida]MBI6883186.1 hypothetical protein [Pseudomonas putida]